jgi:hypothetical protein
MTGKERRDLERRVDGFFATGERIMLRALLFACFTCEVGKFISHLGR